MAAYLDIAGFKARTIMPAPDVDQIQALEPGFIDKKLAERSVWLNARLAKRYAVPFGTAGTPPTDVPEIVLSWLTAMVTLDCYMKRGFNPSSQQDALIEQAATEARDDIREASDSKDGLFDLPLKQSDEGSSGVSRGGPLGYSEASPYTWTDRQIEEVRNG